MIDNTRPAEVSDDISVAVFRYVDVLAAIADQLGLEAGAARIRKMIPLTGSNCDPITLDRIATDALHCARLIGEQIDTQLPQVKQWQEELSRVTSEGADVAHHAKSGPGDKKHRSSVDKARRYRTMYEECRLEIEWCRAGITELLVAAKRGRSIDCPPYPAPVFPLRGEYARWLDSLVPLFQMVTTLLPHRGRLLLSILQRMQSSRARITFGGRFNSGKSSMLNAALGRRLLPTMDLSETGANCHLALGEKDAAFQICDHGREEIPCQTEALRAAMSLRGGQLGTDRAFKVNRIDIRLANFPGGHDVEWIDSPGMFDRSEMTSRAWESADCADVLVWIFHSQQFLGESEAEAIAEYIARRGSASIVFVENAFLRSDVDDPWNYHLTRIAPANLLKLQHLAGELGLPVKNFPHPIIVSAEKALKRGYGFGAAELRRLVGRLAGRDCRIIRRARLQWLHRELCQAVEEVGLKWKELSEENNRREVLRHEYEIKIRSARDRFESAVGDLLNHHFSQFQAAAEAAADVVCGNIDSDNLLRDNTYEAQLNVLLQTKASESTGRLVQRLKSLANNYDQSEPTLATQQSLGKLLTPAYVSFTVVNNDVGGGSIAASAAAGAVVGSVFPIVGTLFGAAFGTVAGLMISGSAAAEKDCEETRVNIRETVRTAVSKLKTDSEKPSGRQILADCNPRPPDEAPPPIDRHNEAMLFDLYHQLESAYRALASWIIRGTCE